MIWNALTETGGLLYGQGEPPAVGEAVRLSDDDPPLMSAPLIGVWDASGAPVGEVDLVRYQTMLRLGNDGDLATDDLDLPGVDGHAKRQLLLGKIYGNKNPLVVFAFQKRVQEEWRMRVEVRGTPPQAFLDLATKPRVRVYENPDYTSVLGESVPMELGKSLVFGDTVPEQVWYANVPALLARERRAPWYFALVVGANRVLGKMVLERDERYTRRLFWG
jgi:hypothetical protein